VSQVFFLLIAGLGLIAALGTVLARNLVHAALFLVAFFFVVSIQFVMLEAEFLAAIQVLVYVGAVAILLMFGIMLTRNVLGDDTTSIAHGWVWPALVVALGMFFVLVFGVNNQIGLKGRRDWTSNRPRPPLVMGEKTIAALEPEAARAVAVNDMGKAVGDQMLTRYAVAFETAGLLLTAALVGAVALAHREAGDDEASRGPGAIRKEPAPVEATVPAVPREA
jgi:NADH:ubiquinone oxidoreductase subunit 6 (subunit J)